jgi:hypothetical protein
MSHAQLLPSACTSPRSSTATTYWMCDLGKWCKHLCAFVSLSISEDDSNCCSGLLENKQFPSTQGHVQKLLTSVISAIWQGQELSPTPALRAFLSPLLPLAGWVLENVGQRKKRCLRIKSQWQDHITIQVRAHPHWHSFGGSWAGMRHGIWHTWGRRRNDRFIPSPATYQLDRQVTLPLWACFLLQKTELTLPTLPWGFWEDEIPQLWVEVDALHLGYKGSSFPTSNTKWKPGGCTGVGRGGVPDRKNPR